MRITLRHLEALYWVSRLGSFTAAAGRLHSTQSAISMRIRDLEETLAQELFDRTARSARLTAEGHELVGYAERVMGLMEEWSYQASVDTVATPPGGDLKLIRADSAKMAVTTDSIVKGFDVVIDVFVRKIAVLIDVLLDPFLFQASEERFGDSIVPAVPFATHARFELV